jgi:hypothetical protein
MATTERIEAKSTRLRRLYTASTRRSQSRETLTFIWRKNGALEMVNACQCHRECRRPVRCRRVIDDDGEEHEMKIIKQVLKQPTPQNP